MKTHKDTLSAAGWAERLGESQDLSQPERQALTDFLRDSPTHVREMIEHLFISEDLKSLPISQPVIDAWVTQARSATHDAIDLSERRVPEFVAPPQPASTRVTRRAGKWLIAACVVGALTLGGLYLQSQLGLYTTAFGEERTLALPDGSVVTLNTSSRMKVSFSDQSRSITLLKGEAFFRVAHDTHRPFVVSAGDALLRVIGTQFNVKLAAQSTVVNVVDGVVKVSTLEDTKAPEDTQVLLKKGEEVRIAPGARDRGPAESIGKTNTTAALRIASWTQGRLEFEGTPLTDVLAEFQRYRHFDVEIDDPSMRQLKLTGSFEAHDPDSLLAYIATLPDIVVDNTGPHSYRIHRR